MSQFSIKYAIQALDKFTPMIRKAKLAVDALNTKTLQANRKAVTALNGSRKAQESLIGAISRTQKARAALQGAEAKMYTESGSAVAKSIANIKRLETEVRKLKRAYASVGTLKAGRLGAAGLRVPAAVGTLKTRNLEAARRMTPAAVSGPLAEAARSQERSMTRAAEGFRSRMKKITSASSSQMLQAKARLTTIALGFVAAISPLIAFSGVETTTAKLKRVAGEGVATDDFLNKLKKMAPALGVMQTDLLKTVTEVNKLGVSIGVSLGAAKSATQFALVSEAPLEETIKQFGNFTQILGVNVRGLPALSSLLLSLGDATTKDPKDVATAMSLAASAFKRVGGSIENAAVLSAFAAEQTGGAHRGGTRIRAVVDSLTKKFDPRFMEALKKGPLEFVHVLKKTLSGKNSADQLKFMNRFTSRARDLVTLMLKNTPRLEKLAKIKQDTLGGRGALVRGLTVLMDTLGFRAKVAASNFVELGSTIGKTMAPAANSFLANFVTPITRGMTDIIDKHSELTGKVMGLGAAMTGLLGVLVAGGLLKALAKFGIATAASSPVLLGITAFAGAAALLVSAKKSADAADKKAGDPVGNSFVRLMALISAPSNGLGAAAATYATVPTPEVKVTIRNYTDYPVEVLRDGSFGGSDRGYVDELARAAAKTLGISAPTRRLPAHN